MTPMTPTARPVLHASAMPESQPTAESTKFLVLHGAKMPDDLLNTVDKYLNKSIMDMIPLDASELGDLGSVRRVASLMGKRDHLVIGAHGGVCQERDDPTKTTHCIHVSSTEKLTSTKSLLHELLTSKTFENKRTASADALPFIYLVSCEAGAVRKEIEPGSEIWKRANLMLIAGTRSTCINTCKQALVGAIAYATHCEMSGVPVDPMHLLFFTGARRGESVTLLGGKLTAPLVWHAPKSMSDHFSIHNLSGAPEDLGRFAMSTGMLPKETFDLLPPASPMEVMCNRMLRDDADGLQKLLAQTPDLAHITSSYGRTVLFEAILIRKTHLLPVLINAGADLNAVDRDGVTALMFAARRGDVEAVNTLLSHGADAELIDASGRTALDFALTAGYTDIIRALLDADDTTKLVDLGGFDSLQRAIKLKDEATVRLLMKHDWCLQRPDQDQLGTLLSDAIASTPRILALVLDKVTDAEVSGLTSDFVLSTICHRRDKVAALLERKRAELAPDADVGIFNDL